MRHAGDLVDLLGTEVTQRRLTQADAAHELGVSQQTLSRWLSGSVHPGDDKLPVLAQFLGRSVEDVADLRGTRASRSRGAVANRLAALEARSATLEQRLVTLAERLEVLADRLDRLTNR